MLDTHETDPQMPVGLKQLMWKIAATLGTSAVRIIAVHILHSQNLDHDPQVYDQYLTSMEDPDRDCQLCRSDLALQVSLESR